MRAAVRPLRVMPLVIGLMVFFAHFLSLQFSRTNIPDVLVLMLICAIPCGWLAWKMKQAKEQREAVESYPSSCITV